MTRGPRLTWSLVLIAAGALLATVGLKLGIDLATGSAVAAFGAALVLAGLDSVLTRSHRAGGPIHGSTLAREHRGWPAVLFGVTFLLSGAALMVVGVMVALGMGEGLLNDAIDSPGPVLMLAGVVTCLAGIATVGSKWTYVDVSTSWWQRLPGQLVGVFITAMGIALLVVGRVFATEPGGSKAAVERIGTWIIEMLSGAG